MWTKLAHFILKYRLLLIIIIGLITGYMGYKASQGLRSSYKFAKVVPDHDPEMQYFKKFVEKFGEDHNVLVVGFGDSAIYKDLEKFNLFYDFAKNIKKQKGITSVIGLPTLEIPVAVHDEQKIIRKELFQQKPSSAKELDSLVNRAKNTIFYQEQLFNTETGSTLMLITLKDDFANSKARLDFIPEFKKMADQFYEESGIRPRIAGVPYVRSMTTLTVKKELEMFLFLSLGVTALVLFLFFRSLVATIFPMIVIGVAVIWSMGSLAILDYKMTILSGLIPPIIVVIGIPNCVYLLNKYHQEYTKHKNKIKALSTVIRKIGIVTLITNFTTSIGFLVLAFNDITILREFGIVAGVNILATFVISIILIPTIYSYLPSPTFRQLRHLDFKLVGRLLGRLNVIVHKHRKLVYIVTTIILVVSIYGTWQIKSVSYMVEDIPETNQIKKDLRFFEREFSGVMPLEVVVDVHDEKGVYNLKNLEKMESFSNAIAEHPDISNPISVISLIKASRQAQYDGFTAFYDLPTKRDRRALAKYLENSEQADDQFLNKFVDTTGLVRMSMKVKDMGSQRMDVMMKEFLIPLADSIFKSSATEDTLGYKITGTTPLFIKGNRFLIENLRYSLIIAFILISLIMAALFGNARIIILSLIPNIIPLLITGALMGFFSIPLKPSTALIFTIAFGISVDDSIHFLAKYRQELLIHRSVAHAVTISIRETGASMFYTSIILFAGFIIFSGSSFLGTIMLGILTSATLLFAMMTNLVVLPSLLMSFDIPKRNKNSHPLIESYTDSDDDEVDENLLKKESKNNVSS